MRMDASILRSSTKIRQAQAGAALSGSTASSGAPGASRVQLIPIASTSPRRPLPIDVTAAGLTSRDLSGSERTKLTGFSGLILTGALARLEYPAQRRQTLRHGCRLRPRH